MRKNGRRWVAMWLAAVLCTGLLYGCGSQTGADTQSAGDAASGQTVSEETKQDAAEEGTETAEEEGATDAAEGETEENAEGGKTAETEETVTYTYTVMPANGEVVDFHTALQQAFLADPYTDGVIGTPPTLTVDGNEYVIDGNPYSSSDLKTRYRMHDDWSRPDPVSLSWEEGEGSASYVLQLAEDEAFTESLQDYTVTENQLEIYNLKIGTDYYWRVVPEGAEIEQGTVYTFKTSDEGPRNICIDGVTNIRDLGGYELEDGSGRIRQGLIYRGGRLNLSRADDDYSLFEEDPDYFELTITKEGIRTMVDELGIRTELDIRVGGETNEIGNMNDDRIPGLTYINEPMDYWGDEDKGANNFTRRENPQRIREIFELLADESSYPLYFHCNIGTDRTGCVAYLIGALCGMSEEDLYINYVFSNFGNIAGSTSPSGRSSSTIYGETGYGTTVNSYPGETLSERTKNALMDVCGLSEETLDRVVEILVEKNE